MKVKHVKHVPKMYDLVRQNVEIELLKKLKIVTTALKIFENVLLHVVTEQEN
jgi:hypothetical protein